MINPRRFMGLQVPLLIAKVSLSKPYPRKYAMGEYFIHYLRNCHQILPESFVSPARVLLNASTAPDTGRVLDATR